MKQTQVHVSTLLLVLVMTILSIIMLFPLLMMVLTSLKTLGEVNAAHFKWFPDQLMFGNYLEAFRRGNWPQYFFNSFLVTAISVVISVWLNSMAGYAFARIPFKGRDILFFFSLIAMMVPAQVTMVPVFIILKHIPFAGGNNLFGQGGIGWINHYMGMIGPHLAHSFGVFLCRQYFLNFSVSLDDAAKIDGCSRFQAYFRIYLPLSAPLIATLAALKTNFVWNDYIWPLIVVNEDKLRTVQLALAYYQTEYGTDWHLLMASTTMIMLPLIVAFLLAQKYFTQSIMMSGVKG